MKKFRFTLQQVLDARSAERQAVEMRLGAKLGELERARAARRRVTGRIAQEIGEIENAQKSGTSRQIYMLHLRYLEGLQQQVLVHARIIARIEQEADVIRQELHRILRACKSLEKLKENEQLAWSHEERREEQAGLDEVAGVAFHMRLEEGGLFWT
jgi:flagellar protein FliJ